MRFLQLSFFLFIHLTVSAQELYFSKPAVFQNLPSVETYHVLQDSKGYIWITTDAGLCRYDGSKFTTYTKKDGISENVVLKGYEDKKGRVWFTTLAGYFFYYKDGRFHEIAANDELKRLCSYFPISGFFIGENDTLFCSTNRLSALLKIPPQQHYKNIIQVTKGFENINRFFYTNKLSYSETIFNRGPVGMNIYMLDSILVNNNGKLLYIPYKSRSLTYSDSRRGMSDKYGNIYFALAYDLIVIRKSTGKVERNKLPLESPVIFMYQDNDEDLWVGTSLGGGYLYKKSDLKSKPIRFLNTLTVCSVMIDREGSVWAATKEKGIFKCNNKNVLFLNEKANYLQKDEEQLNITTKSNKIISIFKTDSMFVNNTFSKYINPGEEIHASLTDSRYCYFNIGPYFYYRSVRDTTRFKKLGIQTADEIFKIHGDTIYTLSSRHFSIIYNKEKVKKMESTFAMKYATQLKDKTILITSRNNSGLYEFNGSEIIPFLAHLPELKTRINHVVEDSAGNLWIATNEHGLYCYDRNKRLHAYPESNIPNKINSLTLDHASNLWAASNQELFQLNYSGSLDKPLIQAYKTANGIPDFQIEKIMEFHGKIWCATNEKLFYFDTGKMQVNTVPPQVYITNVLINDQHYPADTSIPVLDYDQNNIRIFSNVLTYKDPEKRTFLYKLVGYDHEWHNSSNGEIQYTNLDHGSYEFQIYGLNNDGKKSLYPASISFTIKRPFWLTWWFVVLEVLIAGLIIFLSLKYWKNKIEKREKEKTEREREKMILNQKVTEFKMTALRSQMNPHFIFNAIGSIQNYILHHEINQSYEYLSKFAHLIRNILNNSREEYITLSQEIDTLKLYIELERIRFKPPFKFILNIDEALDLEMDTPTMLIQPYVENSIWHGLMPKGKGVLELTFRKEEEHLLVIIKDNGVGRKPPDLEKRKHVSRGMSITEQRIQTLEKTNEKKFVTTIIDLKDDDGNPEGTEVQLIIPFDL